MKEQKPAEPFEKTSSFPDSDSNSSSSCSSTDNDKYDDNFFDSKENKVKQMRKKMEQERIEQVRKLPLNVIRASSLMLNLNEANTLADNLTKRIIQNADITDARLCHQQKESRITTRSSRHTIMKAHHLILKGAKLFNTGGGRLLQQRGPIISVPFNLQTD